MKNTLLQLAAGAALALASAGALAQAPQPPPQGQIQVTQGEVVKLDYLRYEGRYYEIARLYTFRERNCGSDVVVTFVRRIDADVSFVNQCIEKDTSWIMDIGRLVTTGSDQRPGELWFRADAIGWAPWFNGTYRLIELAGDFSYAMLGDPDGSKLWILSRTRQMDEPTYQRLVARASERGYDTSKLIRTLQTGL
ncbi:MAG TPA: lipocalin family protein [Burkholderiales bacterium]|nr:lipocalin family protein [Burkholderiales bacterium]